MTPELWREIERIYNDALQKPEREREAFVAEACGNDTALRSRIRALLTQPSEAGMLDRPAWEAAANLLAGASPEDLKPSARIGPYRIEGLLGAGGMGEVYRATDTRLNRPVAIKFLSAHVAEERERRRFQQEAKTASSLNHPHILTVLDVGEVGDRQYIVSEYVDGGTLRRWLQTRKPNWRQTVNLLVGVADGLACAHEAAILHRDIKPDNILISSNGYAKLADFGLAKLLERSDATDATQTMSVGTRSGVIVGTIAYMSPEQAAGRPVDTRSDIFSFGIVLFEMLTGTRPFESKSNLELVQQIIHQPAPPVGERRPELPVALRLAVDKALEKDPADRYQSMRDLVVDLRRLTRDRQDALPSVPAPARRRVARLLPAVITLALGFGLATWTFNPGDSVAPPTHFRPFATEAAEETWPDWSSDGKAVAYLAEVKGVKQVFTRSLGSPAAVQLTKSRADCGAPFWHPSSARIYYSSEHHLWSIGAAGGEPEIVNQDADRGAISPDGKTLAIVRGNEFAKLWLVSTQDGKEQQYKQAPFPETFRDSYAVAFSPDGSKIGIAFNVNSGSGGYEFWVLPFPSGKPRRAIPPTAAYRMVFGFGWMPDSRHVVLDADIPGVQGSHIYSIDTAGNEVIPITSGTLGESQPSVSPDGKTMAFTSGGTDFDLIDFPLEGGPLRTLLATSRTEFEPDWAPTGSQYVYVTNANGTDEVWLRSLDDGWARPVVPMGADGIPPWHTLWDPQFSRDGTRIVYVVMGTDHTIWVSNLAGARPVRIDMDTADQHGPSWSPDGNWVSYFRLQGGKWEIAKAPVGGGKAVTLMQAAFSYATVWSPSGEWIGFNNAQGLQLISPDGKSHKVLDQSETGACCTRFGFSKDGATVYLLRRGARSWEIVSFDVQTATLKKVSELAVPLTAVLQGFSLNPDGKSFATSVGTTRHDIWLVEDFARKRGWWPFGGSRN